MSTCDFALWLRKLRAERSRRIADLERFIGEPVHFYTQREQSVSDAIQLERSLKQYGLLKPSKWVNPADAD